MKNILIAYLIALPFYLINATVHAAVIHVPADQPTIQTGIDAAAAGDTVLVAAGTYTGDGNRDLDFLGSDIVLMGAGPENTILDLEAEFGDFHRGIYFHSGESQAAQVRNLSIINGYQDLEGGAGILIANSGPRIVNVHLIHNFAPDYYAQPGGGIRCINGSPSIENVLIENCRASGAAFSGSNIELRNVMVVGCSAGEWGVGGGMRVENCSGLIKDAYFSDNSVYDGCNGGAIYMTGPSAPDIVDCTFEDNLAVDELMDYSKGGAIYITEASPVITGSHFQGNWAYMGGAIFCWNGQPQIGSSVFNANNGEMGAGIYLGNSNATLNGLTFHANGGDGFWGDPGYFSGGAIHCSYSSSPVIENCIIGFSTAGYGIQAEAGCEPAMSCSNLIANASGPFGDAMPDLMGIDGNFSLDPLYCGDNSPEEPLALTAGSPCAPDNNDCSTLIGALPVGCDLESHIISGHILDTEGEPLVDVELRGLEYDLLSDETGYYEAWFLEGWSGSLTPLLSGHLFEPASREYMNLATDRPDENYTGRAVTIHHVPGDHPDLQTAFDAVLDGDTVLVAAGVYAGENNRELDFLGRDIVLLSESGSAETIIDCEGAGRGFYLGDGIDAVIQGFTIRNGYCPHNYSSPGGRRGAGIHIAASSSTIRDVVLESCDAEYGGGGIYAADAALVFEDLTLSACTTGDHGAAIHVSNCSGSMTDILAYLNQAEKNGGAIYVISSTINMGNLTLVDNIAGWGGGGLCIDGVSQCYLENSILSFNEAANGGGFFCWLESSSLDVSCSDLFLNSGGNYGGYADDPIGQNGNISLDPQFCDRGNRDYEISTGSPCAGENNSCGVDFGALGANCDLPFFEISGIVTDEQNDPLAGAIIIGFTYEYISDDTGLFTIMVPQDWSGSLSPFLPGYDMDPSERAYEAVNQDHFDQDYTGTRVRLRRVPSEYALIQTALDLSLTADTVLVEPGVYTGPGNKDLEFGGRDIVLISSDGPEVTIIDCGFESRGFNLDHGETAAALVQGFTVRNGDPQLFETHIGGAVRIVDSSPTLRDLILVGNRASLGGAVYISNSQSLLEDMVIADNDTYEGYPIGYGGGIHLYNANPVLRRMLIRDNHAYRDGAGISCKYGSSPHIVGITFVGNTAEWGGGAICVDRESSPIIEECLLVFNTASDGGGIICRDSASNPGLSCNNIFGNEGEDYSGEIDDQTGINGNISEDPLFCDPESGDFFVAGESPCLPENNDCGVLIGMFGEGCTLTSITENEIPSTYTLAGCFPNPFNPATTIRFGLPRSGPVSLVVFDVSGRRAATLMSGSSLEAGWHQLTWDGKNDNGVRLSSGIYLCRLKAGEFQDSIRMILLQ